MTDEQRMSAQAWAKVFDDGPATTQILDEAVQFIRLMDPQERVGASALLVWVMSKRTQLRRSRTKGVA